MWIYVLIYLIKAIEEYLFISSRNSTFPLPFLEELRKPKKIICLTQRFPHDLLPLLYLKFICSNRTTLYFPFPFYIVESLYIMMWWKVALVKPTA